MTDKAHDDALIAEAERLATKATQSTTKSLAWIEECQSALIHLVRSNWQPAPKPDRAEEKSVDTSFQGNRSPTHRCKVCGALWILYSDAWSLCSKECGKCCNNVLMGEQIEPLLHSDLVTWMELPSNMPEPDRAEVLFDELYGKTKDEQIDCFCRHFAELRAEWEAERPAVVVPSEAKLWAESRLNKRSAVPLNYGGIAAQYILDGAKGGE